MRPAVDGVESTRQIVGPRITYRSRLRLTRRRITVLERSHSKQDFADRQHRSGEKEMGRTTSFPDTEMYGLVMEY